VPDPGAATESAPDRGAATVARASLAAELASAFEGAAAGLAVATPEGRVLRANARLCELAGVTDDALVGQDLGTLAGEAPSRWLGVEVTLVRGAGGRPQHLIAHVTDITEDRHMREALTLAQARYHALVAHLPDAFLILFDTDLRVLVAEGRQLELRGIQPGAIEGGSLPAMAGPDLWPRLEAHLRTALDGETAALDLEARAGEVAYSVQTTPLRDEHGRLLGGLSVWRLAPDAGPGVERAAAAREHTEDAELEQFASVASHDLAEPLRSIAGFLDLLKRRHHGSLDPEADTCVDQAVAATERMRGMIDDLLSWSLTGRDERPAEPVAAAALVAEVVERLADHGPPAPRLEVGALPTVPGDPHQLAQLFQNLLANAVKYVPEGRTPHVTVTAERDGPDWRFEVADNGIGVDPAASERIFGMFCRDQEGDEYPGTGIGLAVAKKVVDAHGGRIWAERRPEGGSRFCFTLPG
jgi:signal transduction histidine kinase